MMKFRLAILIVLSLVIIPLGVNGPLALAQSIKEPTGFKSVTLWVYPEYDDARVLMMLEGQITGTDPPAQVRFLVPQTAEMYSAGSKDAQGKYTGGPPARKASSVPGWDEISYTLAANAATFRVEYYDDIIKGNPDKKIGYDFRWLYPISDLRIVIQKPKTATDFNINPAGTQSIEDGFSVWTYNQNNLTLDPNTQPLHFDILYTKSDANPSINNQISAIDPGAPNGGSGSSSSNIIPIAFIVIALVVVVAFMALFIIKRSSRHPTRHHTGSGHLNHYKSKRELRKEKRAGNMVMARPTTRSSAAVMDESRAAVHGNRFCDQCGQPVNKHNKFCANCGNPLVAQN